MKLIFDGLMWKKMRDVRRREEEIHVLEREVFGWDLNQRKLGDLELATFITTLFMHWTPLWWKAVSCWGNSWMLHVYMSNPLLNLAEFFILLFACVYACVFTHVNIYLKIRQSFSLSFYSKLIFLLSSQLIFCLWWGGPSWFEDCYAPLL